MTGDLEDRVRAMLADRAELIDPAVEPSGPLLGPPSGRWSVTAPRGVLAKVLVAAAAAALVVAGLGILAHGHQVAGTTIGPGPSAATTRFPSPLASSPAATQPPSEQPAPVLTQADALRHFFDTDPAWARGFGPYVGQMYCGVDVMGASKDGHYLYLYVDCEGFAITDGVVGVSTASQLPLRATVIGSGPQTRVVALKQPLDGHPFEATLRALFPPVLADRVMNGQFRTEPTLSVLQSQFERSAAAAAARASATSG